ncbi:MAG: hypothetical protein K8H88_11160 [Sandaracinaceae bacterium]|nr:hypothetical protein [Sandaracinaceae bacterium]
MSEESPTAREVFAGSTLEIDAAGDYIIDTHEALGGDVRVRLPPGRSLLVEVDGNTVLEVTNDGSRTRIDLGGGAGERLVLGDALKSLLNEFFTQKFDLHVHPTSMGPSGPPLPAFTGAQMTDAQLSDVARTKKA